MSSINTLCSVLKVMLIVNNAKTPLNELFPSIYVDYNTNLHDYTNARGKNGKKQKTTRKSPHYSHVHPL